MHLLTRLDRLNTAQPADYMPWTIGGRVAGWVLAANRPLLARYRHAFTDTGSGLALTAWEQTVDARSQLLASVLADLRARGWLPPAVDERYPVTQGWGKPPMAIIDRSAADFLGIRAFGQHLDGYVRQPDGGLMLWIGTRSDSVRKYPGKLDHLVAGGLPHGLGLMDNLIKEADEEAGLDPDLVRTARMTGAIRYRRRVETGLQDHTMFLYELDMPRDFVPQNRDGEMRGFALMTPEAVLAKIAEGDAFKFNVNWVLLALMIRHGMITADRPDYLDLVAELSGPWADWPMPD